MAEGEDAGHDRFRQPETEVLKISTTWQGRLIVLNVSGTVDMLTAGELSEAILGALVNRPAGMIVDLTKVEFLASVGMTVLVAAHTQITPTAYFGVVASGPVTARPMQLVGVDRVISVFATLDAALADFGDA